MISTSDAFKKFKSRLELREGEQKNAIKKHTELRELIATKFTLDNDFLTGSYGRHTKIRLLKDVDIFFVLNKEKEKRFLNDPLGLLEEFRKVLAPVYGEKNVTIGRRSVGVDFQISPDDEDKILSIDAVPAFSKGENFQIPDNILKTYIESFL